MCHGIVFEIQLLHRLFHLPLGVRSRLALFIDVFGDAVLGIEECGNDGLLSIASPDLKPVLDPLGDATNFDSSQCAALPNPTKLPGDARLRDPGILTLKLEDSKIVGVTLRALTLAQGRWLFHLDKLRLNAGDHFVPDIRNATLERFGAMPPGKVCQSLPTFFRSVSTVRRLRWR
jgi:hypothetical protein